MFGGYMKNKAQGGKRKKQSPQSAHIERQQLGQYANMSISPSLHENKEYASRELGHSDDIVFRVMTLPEPLSLEIMLIYVRGMISDEMINEFVVKALHEAKTLSGDKAHYEQALELLEQNILLSKIVEKTNNWETIFKKLLSEACIIMVEGGERALTVNISGSESRSIEEPKTEMTIRGPREGFTESIGLNTVLLRRRLRTPKLWTENFTIGTISQTRVNIVYIKGLADEEVVEELRERLNGIEIDAILESNYIEELITDDRYTLFPTVMNHERPDAIAASLVEGRVAILTDGTPFVLTIPAPLNVFFQSPEDYYQRYDVATLLRLLRFVAFGISLLMPSVYVAILCYHQEMIPTPLLLKLAAQHSGVPFPVYVEAFLMEFLFEILREAVLRMPNAAGNTISIVGGLVIGQSVVEAGIVSPSVVIAVAITAIASFVSPSYSLGVSARVIRFLLLIAATTLGFYGIALVLLLLLLHMSSLKSFGIPYLKSFAPFYLSDMKDTVLRVPIWLMKSRPKLFALNNKVRENLEKDVGEERKQ